MDLRDLEHGADIDRVLLVRGADLRQRPGSRPFLRLELADRSEAVAAMVWEDAETVATVARRGAPVHVRGRLEVHERYGRQVAVTAIEAVDPQGIDLTVLVPGPSVPVPELEGRLRALVARTADRWVRTVLERVFAEDGPFWARFRMAPAAKHFHEAYPHGLLDHTVRVAEGVEALVPTFGGVDRDVAVGGALLHDIGKAHAYTSDPLAPDLTDLGRLEGHIVLGYEVLRRVIGGIDGFPETTARSLRHVVLSHHGKQEYGSPVVPATREALLVHQVDDLAARMGGVDRMLRGTAPDATWTAFERALGGAVYVGPARDEGPAD